MPDSESGRLTPACGQAPRPGCPARSAARYLAGVLEEGTDLGHGLGVEVERHEEALGAVLASHHGLEGVTRLFRSEPRTQRSGVSVHAPPPLTPLADSLRAWLGRSVVHEVQLAGLLAALGHAPDREDAAVDAHVADLGLVRDAARAR